MHVKRRHLLLSGLPASGFQGFGLGFFKVSGFGDLGLFRAFGAFRALRAFLGFRVLAALGLRGPSPSLNHCRMRRHKILGC